MRLLEYCYQMDKAGIKNVRIFSDRPYGYKRFIVEWPDKTEQMYSGIWYKKEQIIEKVEREIDRRAKEF